ncbi:DUF2637 domain-containing protein [Nonomuraea dietziae]|uniref:DUF2637 domain-containing protein n=1 Tax=Nonomuraea dietziae TaxID=65515 RepID=UPI003438918E
MTATADRWIRWTTTSSVVLVAGIAAVVSYRHMHELALRHGESLLGAMLVPLAVDGMIVASSMSILLSSRYGRRGGFPAWSLLIIGSLASLSANVAVADPTLIARIIAAWPSFSLIGAYEMLMGQIRHSHANCEIGERRPGAGDKHQDLRRRAWLWALANRAADGSLPSGTAIATQFSRSSRWGRWIKRAGAAGELG